MSVEWLCFLGSTVGDSSTASKVEVGEEETFLAPIV